MGVACLLPLPFLVFGCTKGTDPAQVTEYQSGSFLYTEIDDVGPNDPWGKAIGDLNNDGRIDIIVGGHEPQALTIMQRIARKLRLRTFDHLRGELVWYQSPNWEKHSISSDYAIRTDIESGDMDNDGDLDVIAVTDVGVGWFENPDWEFHLIKAGKLHDVEAWNLDDDPELEIVVRNQSLFGYDNGDEIRIFDRANDHSWTETLLSAFHGEGLLVTDINSDSRLDILVNKVVYLNSRLANGSVKWNRFQYDTNPESDDVFIAAADIDGDGLIDIVNSPSEPAGSMEKVSWFRNSGRPGVWSEHVIDANVESVRHFVGVADFDSDGNNDVVTAAMPQGKNPAEVAVYWNKGNGDNWQKEVIGSNGSHSMRIVDVNGDFAPDLIGANWQHEDQDKPYPVQLWLNQSKLTEDWQRHVIDEERPGTATFVFAEDLNQDDLPDIVTGGYWYLNPGSIDGNWQRRALGPTANNAALILDYDRDGLPDVLASNWRGYLDAPTLWQRFLNRTRIQRFDYDDSGNKFVWAHNLGDGEFAVLHNIEIANGDFLQGAAVLQGVNSSQIFLSWHSEDSALQVITEPADLTNGIWTITDLPNPSEDEALTVVDINADGIPEIVTGTRALVRSIDSDNWVTRRIVKSSERPDRHSIADIDGDGIVDLVIGYEAVSRSGLVAWYKNNGKISSTWEENIIAKLIGPMSLSTSDMDDDGDLDIVVGEHNLENPTTARLIWFENLHSDGSQWAPRLIGIGDEHHDGALSVDLDNDGDIDVVSIGWGHNRVLIYENRRVTGN